MAVNHFQTLVDRAMRTQSYAHMRPVIEKELLHYDILFALDSSGLLDNLTFQGGTSLRLCYGAPRFSENLDFVGGLDFATKNLISMKQALEKYLGTRYGLAITVKEPHQLRQEFDARDVQVSQWQIRIVTHPGQKDIPKQMIKIEVVNLPALTKIPRQLRKNYDFLPDGYSDTIVTVESLDEIMADKLISLPNCQAYIRHRDIWDLRWLRQQQARVDMQMIRQKVANYHIEDYPAKIERLLANLPTIIASKEFRDQMSRFLPIDVQARTLQKEKFLTLLTHETVAVFTELKTAGCV